MSHGWGCRSGVVQSVVEGLCGGWGVEGLSRSMVCLVVWWWCVGRVPRRRVLYRRVVSVAIV